MTNKKTTKRALTLSIISMLICVVMLAGTTFAWFTDSVTSGRNQIVAGNLDITVEYSRDGENWDELTSDTKVFNDSTLWEPGHTEVAAFRVKNVGTLALKYEVSTHVYKEALGINVADEKFKLSDYLDVYVGVPQTNNINGEIITSLVMGSRDAATGNGTYMELSDFDELVGNNKSLEPNGEDVMFIAIQMPETVGNEANYKTGTTAPSIEFGVNIVATQAPSEYDSFDDQYDKDAFFAGVYASDVDGLKAGLKDGEYVALTNDMTVPAGESNSYGKTGLNQLNGGTIDGNGHAISVTAASSTWDSAINTTGGTIKNVTINKGFRGIFVNHNSAVAERVYLENVVIDGPVYTISCDQGTGNGLTAKNSTFNGWTSYAATIGDVEFIDCNFGEGAGYSYCRPYAPTAFVGCEFEAGYRIDARAAVTFENCTFDGVAITADNVASLVTSNTANATVK